MELEVRGRNLSLSEPIEALVERRFAFALGRFSNEIRRVDVKLADINGPRGGVDKLCKVEVTLAHGGRVRAQSTELLARDAIDRAAERVGRRLSRKLGRAHEPRHAARLPI